MASEMVERCVAALEAAPPGAIGDFDFTYAHGVVETIIEAMREPTAAVLQAMRDTVPVDGYEWEYRDDEALLHWRAMIGAALGEGRG